MTPVHARRILLLAPFPPGGVPAHGGSQAIAGLAEALSVNNQIAVAYLRADDETAAAPSLHRHCDALFEVRRPGSSLSSIRPLGRVPRLLPLIATGHPLWVASRWSAEFAALVRRLGRTWRPSIVQAEFGAMGMYLAIARQGGARTVVTFHDANMASSAGPRAQWLLGGLTKRADAALWRTYDRRLMRCADAVVALTDRDAAALTALSSGVAVDRIHLGVRMPAGRPRRLDSLPPLVLFVGNFNHPPNVDAVRYLLDEVWPRVSALHPELRLAIVGDNAPGWLRACATATVQVPGYVQDLDAMLREATIFVAPIRTGGGMRVKVLEALAAGIAVVGTPLAFEGTGVVHGRHAIVADGTEAFCAGIDQLIRNTQRGVDLGRAARGHVASTLSWERAAAGYEAVYDRLLVVSAVHEQAGEA